MCLQVLGKMNVRFEVGPGQNPHETTTDELDSECLITVYAMEKIRAGAELLSTYGPDYWQQPPPK